MNSNLWKIALALLPILGTAAEFTTPTRFSAAVEFGVWTNRPTISQASNLTGGASAATGTFSYAVQPTNSLGRGITSASSNASFTATGQLIRIRWNPVGGATGYRIFRGLTNWIDAGSATQFLDYGTNIWSNGAPTTTTTAGAISGPLTIPTNTYLGNNAESSRVARIGDIAAGTVTNNQWLPDVYAVGVVASGALQRTGGTVTGTVTITGTNMVGGRVTISNGSDISPIMGHAGTFNVFGAEYSGMVGGLMIVSNPASGVFANLTIGHVLLPGQFSGVHQSFSGLVDLLSTGTSGDFWKLQFSDALGGSTVTLARVVGDSTGGSPPQIIVSNGVFYGNGAGLTNLPGSSSVRLTTNLLLVLDSTVGDWSVARQVSGPTTNNSVTVPVGDGYATVDGRTFPIARIETQMTNTWQTRTVVSRMVEAGEVATNIAAVRIVFPGSSAAATNTVNFLGPSSNVFASCVVTNATNYDLTASLFATNRRWHAQVHGFVPPAVGTNTGWLGLMRVEVIKQ